MTDCEDDEDISRGQSPMIPLTIERSVAIKAEPSDTEFLESVKNEEYMRMRKKMRRRTS